MFNSTAKYNPRWDNTEVYADEPTKPRSSRCSRRLVRQPNGTDSMTSNSISEAKSRFPMGGTSVLDIVIRGRWKNLIESKDTSTAWTHISRILCTYTGTTSSAAMVLGLSKKDENCRRRFSSSIRLDILLEDIEGRTTMLKLWNGGCASKRCTMILMTRYSIFEERLDSELVWLRMGFFSLGRRSGDHMACKSKMKNT